MPVYEDERGTYIMNSRDLCMIEHIPELYDAGITSFKIEGRMKSSFYVASVVKSYRQAIDEFERKGRDFAFNEKWLHDLKRPSHREFSTGFYFGSPGQVYTNSSYIRDYDIIGMVLDYDEKTGMAFIEQRNRVFRGETVEVFSPDMDTFNLTLDNIWNEDGEEIDSAPHPQMKYYIKCGSRLKQFDMLIRMKEE
jgi:putative protease